MKKLLCIMVAATMLSTPSLAQTGYYNLRCYNYDQTDLIKDFYLSFKIVNDKAVSVTMNGAKGLNLRVDYNTGRATFKLKSIFGYTYYEYHVPSSQFYSSLGSRYFCEYTPVFE